MKILAEIILKNRWIKAALTSLSLTLLALPVVADEGAIRFSNNAYKQEIGTDKNGNKTFNYVEPSLVLPGDVILYEIGFENISKDVISNIVINTPLPNNSKYRAGSVTGNATEITFSLDGKEYKEADALIVKDKSGKSWLAKPEEYKAIRWVYKKALKPGEKGKVTYKTQIKK